MSEWMEDLYNDDITIQQGKREIMTYLDALQ